MFVHKDGHFYPVGFTASPIRDDAAKIIGTIIEVRDITEEKAAAERQRLLTNELNHRVKNTLATVQSIAAQTFRAISDQPARAVFDARVTALSNAHNVLTESNWESASLIGVVERAIAPHAVAEADANRFQITGPDTRLHPKVAVTLAMALHELMTNAAKFGALSVPEGRVTVVWTLKPDGARERLSLTWTETGGPEVAPPTRKGFRFPSCRATIALGVRRQRRDRFRTNRSCLSPRYPADALGLAWAGDRDGATRLMSMLEGRRVLLVEDGSLVAMLAEDMLLDLGCEVVIAMRLEQALRNLQAETFDLAVLDVNLGDARSYPVADKLFERCIPFLFATGYGAAGVEPAYRTVPVMQKPYQKDDLETLLQHLLTCETSQRKTEAGSFGCSCTPHFNGSGRNQIRAD